MATTEEKRTERAPRLTTLCYLEKDGRYLVLHRTKKEHDENGGKWIGVGDIPWIIKRTTLTYTSGM